MIWPKISIITPTYNQGQFLEKTILSVIEQGYPNLEFIVIDGGSTDQTVSLLEKYDDAIDYWISEKDNGQSHAINKGLAIASGDIVNWLNSDDWLAPGTLKIIGQEFDQTTDLLCGNAILEFPKHQITKQTSRLEGSLTTYLSTAHIMQPATFFRKSVFKDADGVLDSLHFMMDHYLFLTHIAKHGLSKTKWVEHTFCHVLMHEDAKSMQHLPKFLEDADRIFSALFRGANKTFFTITGEKDLEPVRTISIDNKILNQIEFDSLNLKILRFHLFKRDEFGKRLGLNYRLLFKLLFSAPQLLFPN